MAGYDKRGNHPQRRTDAIFRIVNTDRYDDRDVIITNLLMHRDFSSGYVAKFIIEKDDIRTESANLSHGYGALKLATFEPFPKNPPISKVFREIGLADELGSGMRNTYKYTKMYSGREPQLIRK